MPLYERARHIAFLGLKAEVELFGMYDEQLTKANETLESWLSATPEQRDTLIRTIRDSGDA